MAKRTYHTNPDKTITVREGSEFKGKLPAPSSAQAVPGATLPSHAQTTLGTNTAATLSVDDAYSRLLAARELQAPSWVTAAGDQSEWLGRAPRYTHVDDNFVMLQDQDSEDVGDTTPSGKSYTVWCLKQSTTGLLRAEHAWSGKNTDGDEEHFYTIPALGRDEASDTRSVVIRQVTGKNPSVETGTVTLGSQGFAMAASFEPDDKWNTAVADRAARVDALNLLGEGEELEEFECGATLGPDGRVAGLGFSSTSDAWDGESGGPPSFYDHDSDYQYWREND